MGKLTIDEINSAPERKFTAALANVFEYSPWIAETAACARPFEGVQALFESMVAAVDAAPLDRQMALIAAHPDLADRTQRAAGLTEESSAEQTSVGLDRLSDAEYDAFADANAAYRVKFGFPYIICVRRHTKDSILRDFAQRLPNEKATEVRASLAEIVRIAALRLDVLVSGNSPLKVHGRLSTHVLDTTSGKPAAGVAIELVEKSTLGADRIVTRAITNADGRTDTPLIGGRPVPAGRYELRFAVASYFAERGVTLSEPPFLEMVPLQFGVSEPEGHLHVPLLVTPWSYATYRGS